MRDNHPPRKLPIWKYYMQHPDRKESVATEVDLRWATAGLDRSRILDFRCSVAKELWENETDEYRASLEQEWTEDHAREVEEYEESAAGSPSASPEDQAE